jgi:hypothetical protein
VLYVVTIRSSGQKYAEGHISEENSSRVFCGISIPAPVMECGLANPANPYVGKAKATCSECVSEWANGRRSGYREDVNAGDG